MNLAGKWGIVKINARRPHVTGENVESWPKSTKSLKVTQSWPKFGKVTQGWPRFREVLQSCRTLPGKLSAMLCYLRGICTFLMRLEAMFSQLWSTLWNFCRLWSTLRYLQQTCRFRSTSDIFPSDTGPGCENFWPWKIEVGIPETCAVLGKWSIWVCVSMQKAAKYPAQGVFAQFSTIQQWCVR